MIPTNRDSRLFLEIRAQQLERYRLSLPPVPLRFIRRFLPRIKITGRPQMVLAGRIRAVAPTSLPPIQSLLGTELYLKPFRLIVKRK